jgi:predicted N-acyltransferase
MDRFGVMQTEFHSTIFDFDEREWDALAPQDILASYGWLATVEESTTEQIGFLYIVVRDGGKLIGAAVCHMIPDRKYDGLDYVVYGSAMSIARHSGLKLVPALVVGSRYGLSAPFLIADTLPEDSRAEVRRQLLESVVEHANEISATLIVRNAGPADTDLRDAHLIPTPEMPTTYLDIRWRTFEEYRKALSQIHPRTAKALRHARNVHRRRGLVAERITQPAQCTAELHGLLASQYERLNEARLPFNGSFLANTLKHLGDRVTIRATRDDSGYTGIELDIVHGDYARSMMIGIDQGRGRTAGAYFFLIDDGISWAIEAGHRRYYLGRMMYNIKLRRGFSLALSTMWIGPRNAYHRVVLRPFLRLRTAKMGRMISAMMPVSDANTETLGGDRI